MALGFKQKNVSNWPIPHLLFVFSVTYIAWLTAHLSAFQSLGWFIVDKQEAMVIPLWGVLASAIQTSTLLIFYVYVKPPSKISIAKVLTILGTVILTVTLLFSINQWSNLLPWVPRRSIFMFGLIELGLMIVFFPIRNMLTISSNFRWVHFISVCIASAGGLLYLHTDHILSIVGLTLSLLALGVGIYSVISYDLKHRPNNLPNPMHATIFFVLLALVVTLLGKWSIIPFDLLNKIWMPSLVQDRAFMVFLVATIVVLGMFGFLWRQSMRSTAQKSIADWPSMSLIAIGLSLMVIDRGANFIGFLLVLLALIQLFGYNFQHVFCAPQATKYVASSVASVFLVGLCLMTVEAGLLFMKSQVDDSISITDQSNGGNESSRNNFLVMPTEWEHRKVNIEGAKKAFYWQGKLHIMNKHGMRTIGDYEYDPDVRRIVVLGDSITYGVGIDQNETYASVLENLLRALQPQQPIKVYNLGVIAMNSEQVAIIAKKWIPRLKPERVIYGLCLNDFEDWDGDTYANNMRWAVPAILSKPFVENTLLGELISRGYNQFLLRIGIRQNYYQDVFDNIGNRADRLSRDVSYMNDLVLKYTGMPLLVLVVTELDRSSNPKRLTMIAEQQAKRGGAEVIPTTEYFKKYGDGHLDLKVSRWEGHPNALMNRIWAEIIFDYLSK